jgi:hypothetical protein
LDDDMRLRDEAGSEHSRPSGTSVRRSSLPESRHLSVAIKPVVQLQHMRMWLCPDEELVGIERSAALRMSTFQDTSSKYPPRQLDYTVASSSSPVPDPTCRLLGIRLLPLLPSLLDRRPSLHPLVPRPAGRVLGLPFLAKKRHCQHIDSPTPNRSKKKNKNSPYRTPPP